jgi:hypothetical protein
MKETLLKAVGFRLALPNLQILAVSQFQLSSLEEASPTPTACVPPSSETREDFGFWLAPAIDMEDLPMPTLNTQEIFTNNK